MNWREWDDRVVGGGVLLLGVVVLVLVGILLFEIFNPELHPRGDCVADAIHFVQKINRAYDSSLSAGDEEVYRVRRELGDTELFRFIVSYVEIYEEYERRFGREPAEKVMRADAERTCSS